MSWHAQLKLRYRLADGKTVLDHAHDGPLRILQSLYPEGDALCHNVMLHPPGGVAGGDDLDIDVHVAAAAHALITTPGATRFYKSSGAPALQRARITMDNDSRLEWLPLENIAYNGCLAENRLQIQLAPTAELIGWDITALGLPAAQQAFERGHFTQHLELLGPTAHHSAWLEYGRISADDQRLLHSRLGLNGKSCLATLFFIAGSPIETRARERFLSEARDIAAAHALGVSCGTTCPHSQVIIVRALADHAEHAIDLCKQIRAAWRTSAWGLPPVAPRIWSM